MGATLGGRIGIEFDGETEDIFSRTTSLPAQQTHTFTTSINTYQNVQIRVFQDRIAAEEDDLGKCSLTVPPGEQEIKLLFQLDEAGRVRASVTNQNAESRGLRIEGVDELRNASVDHPQMTGKILAIDFGTTTTTCAVTDGSDPQIIANRDGDRALPTALGVDADGNILFGKEARKQAIKNPSRAVVSVKKTLFQADGPVKLGDEKYTPEKIAGLFFKKLRSDAEDALNQSINQAVVTISASCSIQQRNRIKRAGSVAGLTIERVITNTAAAAMGARPSNDSDSTVLACDFGGGTFDVGVLHVYNGVYEHVATNWDNDLGGDDWDELLINHLAGEFENDHGIDLHEDRQALQRLKKAAGEAKIDLTNKRRTTVNIPHVTATDSGPLHLQQSITRETFEELTSHLIERVVETIEQTLPDADNTKHNIDEVILVGGLARMSRIQNKITELFSQSVVFHTNPEDAVALGAAIQAGVLDGNVNDIVLLPLTPRSIGVQVDDEEFERIIGRNSLVPTEESKMVTTTADNLDRVPIRVFYGDPDTAAESELLTEFVLTELVSSSKDPCQIEITVNISEIRDVEITAEHDAGSDHWVITPEEQLPIVDLNPSSDTVSEPLIRDCLTVRNLLNRGILYCTTSIDHQLEDLRDTLKQAAETADSAANCYSEDKGEGDIEKRGKELQNMLIDVSMALKSALNGNLSNQWTLGDIESLIGDIDRELEATGLQLINPDSGTQPDPYRHQVVSSTDSSLPEGRVVSVQQIGYERGGEIQQEAKVTVSSRETSSSKSQIDSNETVVMDCNPPVPSLSAVRRPPRREMLSSGDLRISEQIGEGGQAVIHKATLPDSQQPPEQIAIRQPKPGDTLTRRVIEAFHTQSDTWEIVDAREREKQRWADSEHIVGVVAVGDNEPWLAMEYMDGGDLEDLLAEHPHGLPPAQALWIGECVCKALRIAHPLGRAHLDVKPENVLLKDTDGWPWPKVADWGLARTLAEETGTVSELSVEYAAPEQFDSAEFGDPDELTDIYQTGALVQALLTGDPPATGSHLEVKQAVTNEEPLVMPTDRRSELPSTVDAAIGLALEREKTDRYDSINEFWKALRAIRTDKPLPRAVESRHREN